MRFELPSAASEGESAALPRVWLAATTALFMVVHVGTDLVIRVVGGTIRGVSIGRAIAFYVLAAVVVWPFLRGMVKVLKDAASERLLRRSLALSVPTFAAACAFVFPHRGDDGFVSLAVLYYRMSRVPFAQHSGWLHKRLLLPAVAYPLPQDPSAYWTLSLAIAFLGVLAMVLLTESWLERAGATAERPLVRLPIHIALVTLNPVIFSFQGPGYPDLLGLGLVWIAVAFPLSARARASAIAIAVIAHEAVFAAALPLVLLGAPKAERRLVLAVTAAYSIGWLASASAAVHAIQTQQFRPQDLPAWEWLAAFPLRAVAGVAMAFKAMWLVVAAAAVAAWRIGDRRFTWAAVTVVMIPVLLLPFAVDTSRVAGFGVAGLIACLAFVWARAESSRSWRVFAWAVAVVTILLPSTYIAVNTGEVVVSGLYALLRRGTISVE